MTRATRWLVLCLVLLSATACTDGAVADDVVTLRLGHGGSPGDVLDQSIEILTEHLDEHTEGRVVIENYGASQLGNERDLIEGVGIGTVDMTLVTNAPLGNFVPEALFYDLPALYADLDHVHAVAESSITTEVLAGALLERDMRLLTVTDGGFRHITNRAREITEPQDLAGIKMRVQESAVIQATYEAIDGVTAVPVPIGDLYTALEQGVVDAQENPTILTRDFQFNEVQAYMTLTAHSYFPRHLIINEDAWEQLRESDQQALQEGAEIMKEFKNAYYEDEDEQAREELEERGMTVSESTSEFDEALQERMQAEVWPQFYEQIGGGNAARGEEIVDEIMAMESS